MNRFKFFPSLPLSLTHQPKLYLKISSPSYSSSSSSSFHFKCHHYIHKKVYIRNIPAHIHISQVKDNARGKWWAVRKEGRRVAGKVFISHFFQPFQNVRLHHKQDKHGERDEILDSSRFIASHVWGMNFPLV